jgi:cellulose biosynthesis protein BcsQ
MAAAAWWLAQKGKRVMVLDLDLESPGLSSSLLPEGNRPKYGITDWLLEDLVDNGEALLDSMWAMSDLSHDGEILIVPAHGKEPGEYVPKLGRAWMSKLTETGERELWPARLSRLLADLERSLKPDVILIDSRAGIDEVASACVTSLGAKSILLFAMDSEQTWTGYDILFRHWRQTEAIREIRERLQIIGAMIPEFGGEEYFKGLLERAWDIFTRECYDEVPAGENEDERFNYDRDEDNAPHYPWKVKWNRDIAALQSIHARLKRIDPSEVVNIFGPLLAGIENFLETEKG